MDGSRRPIYEDARGQYVRGDDGQPLYGVWLFPDEDDADLPMIVDAGNR